MDLDNLFEVRVHYFLIGRMIGLKYHRDGVPIVSVLTYMITYWIRPRVSHDVRLFGSYDFTRLLCCVVFQP